MIGIIVFAAIPSMIAALLVYRSRGETVDERSLCHCGNTFGPQHLQIARGATCELCGRQICAPPGQAYEFLLRCTLISSYTVAIMVLLALPSIASVAVLGTYWLSPVCIVLGIALSHLIYHYTPVGRWYDFINIRLDAIDIARAEGARSRFSSRYAEKLSKLSPGEASEIEQAAAAQAVFHKDPVIEVLVGVGSIISGGASIFGVLFVVSFWNLVPNDQVMARYTLTWYGVWSLVAFVAMYWDKSLARSGSDKRIAERKLHFFEMMGGFPGSLAAQWIFRHKVRKFSYQVVFYLIVAVHLCAWLWLLVQQR